MNQQDYILDAIEMVSAWPDIPLEDFGRIVNQQVHLMQGLCQDDFPQTFID